MNARADSNGAFVAFDASAAMTSGADSSDACARTAVRRAARGRWDIVIVLVTAARFTAHAADDDGAEEDVARDVHGARIEHAAADGAYMACVDARASMTAVCAMCDVRCAIGKTSQLDMFITTAPTSAPPRASLTLPRAPRVHRVSRAVVAAKKPAEDAGKDQPARGFPTSSSQGSARGPGAAPLRMETQEQRKFGYGGDGLPPDDDDDEESWDDGWNPGREGQPSPWGLVILLVVGAWALWEYKRPGGSLNPETKKALQRARYMRAYKARYGHYPGEGPQPGEGGATGSIRGI